MKTHTFILVVLASLLFAQCKKETVAPVPGATATFLLQAQQFVQQKTSPADYGQLDWERAKVYQQNGVNQMVRVPLLGKTHPWQRAVYLTYANGSFSGNYFELVNNTITTVSLDKERECVAPLSADGRLGGYRVYEKGQLIAQNTAMRNAVYIIRPPVIIYDINYGLYYLIETLGLGQGGNGEMGNAPSGTVNYLGAIPDGGELVGQGGGGGVEIIEMELDSSASKPAVDIKKLFKCFDAVPDFPGTVYTMKLCTDIPANGDPNMPWVLRGFNPGHSFVIITKTNGSNSVTQAFGFYPIDGKENITSQSPVTSKIIDDKYHEINASIEITNLDPMAFRQIRLYAEDIFSKRQYDIINFNCSNFAIDLFNLARPSSNQIEVEPFHANVSQGIISPPVIWVIPKSPQGLFKELKRMKDANAPDAPNIIIQNTHNYRAPQTNGECN